MNVIKSFNISEKVELQKINEAIAKFKEVSLHNLSEAQRFYLIKEAMMFYLTAKLFTDKIKAKATKSRNRDRWKDHSFFFKSYLLEKVNKNCFFRSLGEMNNLLIKEESSTLETEGEAKVRKFEHIRDLARIMYELLEIRNAYDRVTVKKCAYQTNYQPTNEFVAVNV